MAFLGYAHEISMLFLVSVRLQDIRWNKVPNWILVIWPRHVRSAFWRFTGRLTRPWNGSRVKEVNSYRRLWLKLIANEKSVKERFMKKELNKLGLKTLGPRIFHLCLAWMVEMWVLINTSFWLNSWSWTFPFPFHLVFASISYQPSWNISTSFWNLFSH